MAKSQTQQITKSIYNMMRQLPSSRFKRVRWKRGPHPLGATIIVPIQRTHINYVYFTFWSDFSGKRRGKSINFEVTERQVMRDGTEYHNQYAGDGSVDLLNKEEYEIIVELLYKMMRIEQDI